jgi:hypothetical protein
MGDQHTAYLRSIMLRIMNASKLITFWRWSLSLPVLTMGSKHVLVQINYCAIEWTTYSLFVLNKGWKLNSVQVMIFVYVCSTCSVVALKRDLKVQ